MSSSINPTTSVSLDALSVGRSSTNPFITIFSSRNPTSADVNYPIQQRWYNDVAETEYILTSFSIVSEVKTAVWQPINASQMAATETLTGNSGGAVAVDVNNNINVIGDTTTINVTGNPGTHTLTISTVDTGVVNTLTGNSGGAVSPSAGNINTIGDGTTITIVGNPGTHTLTASTGGHVATLYTEDSGTATPSAGNLNVLGGSTGLTTLGSGSTISLTGTLNVSHGGTGDTSFTAYAPITGGTTSTGPLQSASTGQSTSGFVFTSTGAGSLPTFQSIFTAGSITPVLQFGGASTGITYSARGGQYTLMGNVLFFAISFTLTSKGSSTGVATIAGFPNAVVGGGGVPVDYGNITFSVGNSYLYASPVAATTTFQIFQTGSGLPSSTVTDTNFSNTSVVVVNGFYFIS